MYAVVSFTVYPKKYAHGFVVLCFVVVMQSFIMNSHEVFIHIHQGCFAGTGAIVRLPQCQRSKPDGYGKISQCITATKHSKAKTVCIFLGIYCTCKYRVCLRNLCFDHEVLCNGRTNVRYRFKALTQIKCFMVKLGLKLISFSKSVIIGPWTYLLKTPISGSQT